MKVLLAIPHVFAPKEGSLYSSQTEAKRQLKQDALLQRDDRESQPTPASSLDSRLTWQKPTGCESRIKPRWR